MRIGTWNLDAKWTARHAALIGESDADVWLLTEVNEVVSLPGYELHRCGSRMSRGQHFAAIMSRLPLTPLPDPHPASASAEIDGLTFCASVLPWASKDDPAVWGDGDQGQRTRRAVDAIAWQLAANRSMCGGDFNHALAGPTRWAGSVEGRKAILELVEALELNVPTADLPHRRPGTRSTDHVSVPRTWTVEAAVRVAVPAALSDHDLYIVAATAST